MRGAISLSCLPFIDGASQKSAFSIPKC
jgi:hypothetical protein